MKEISEIINDNRQCGQTSALIQVCQSHPNALLIMGKEDAVKTAIRNGCPAGQVVTVQDIGDKELSGTILLWDNTALQAVSRLTKRKP